MSLTGAQQAALYFARKRRRAGPQIQLSTLRQEENTAIGTAIGTLSVRLGRGTYTFTKTADPDSVFTLTGSTLKNAVQFDYETAIAHSVTIQADNGEDDVLTHTFSISVGNVVGA